MRDAALARPHQGCSVASLVWSSGGALYVTVVVKATVALRDGGPARLVTPAPIVAADRWSGRESSSSLLAACELFPYRPRVDVTYVGQVQLPAGGVASVRLAASGEGGWFDKTLEVRPPPARGRTRSPATRVAMAWEGTWADADNALGVAPDGSAGAAWILDPARPGSSAGLGPMPPGAPRRAGSFGGADPRLLDEDAPRFPEGFDWEHFHVAPADQQLPWIVGTETLELDGLIEGVPHLSTRLPGLAAAAWAFAPWEIGEGQPVDLVPDGIVIEGDRALAHVLWRGTYPLLGSDWSLSQLQILASVTAAESSPEPVVVPPPARTLTGLGPPPGLGPAPLGAPQQGGFDAASIPSLFDSVDEEEGTRPLTRKQLLAAMAAAGRALPFGAPRARTELGKTAELELPPPSAPPPPEARSEETRRLPLDRVFTADADGHTVSGDDDDRSAASSEALPPWLRASSADEASVDADTGEQPAHRQAGGLVDEDTHVTDDDPGRR